MCVLVKWCELILFYHQTLCLVCFGFDYFASISYQFYTNYDYVVCVHACLWRQIDVCRPTLPTMMLLARRTIVRCKRKRGYQTKPNCLKVLCKLPFQWHYVGPNGLSRQASAGD